MPLRYDEQGTGICRCARLGARPVHRCSRTGTTEPNLRTSAAARMHKGPSDSGLRP
jgi:hypothetical protein